MESSSSRRSEPDAPEGAHPLILFDGVCNLCNSLVQRIIARDERDVFRFASLQSDAAARALAAAGAPEELPDSVILIDGEGVHVRSDAALRIARGLGAPRPLVGAMRLVPRFARDAVYRFVAKHRYGWFGKRDACPMPTPALRKKFLDAEE